MWNTFENAKEILKNQYQEHCWRDGLTPDGLERTLSKVMAENDQPFARAKCIDLVLRQAQIDICPEEFFVDKINHAGLLNVLFYENVQKLQEECGQVFVNAVTSMEIKAASANVDFGHIAPDWDFLMENGIVGVLERLEQKRAESAEDSDKTAFYDASILVYQGVLELLKRFAQLARSYKTEKMDFVADNLVHLIYAAPQTLAEAMQLTLIYYSIQTYLDCTPVRSLGGLDHLYAPFYRRDLQSGRFSDAQLRELTADFLWKISAMRVTANLPFYICGKDANGNDQTNEFTRILLEEYRKLNIYDPKMHVMYHPGMNGEVLDLLLEMIREGKNSFVFINTEVVAKALQNIGIEEKDAKRQIIYGCYEAAAEGTEVPTTCGGNINLAKAVELAMNNGADLQKGTAFGPETGEDFEDFEAFFAAVREQLKFITVTCMDAIAAYETRYPKYCPTPVISATFASSVEKGRDLYAGGAKYNNTSVVGAGLATLTDSVMMVKKLVFEKKMLSFRELRACLANNWEQNETLRSYCLAQPEKYGNNHPEADAIAVALAETFTSCVNNRPNGRGGVFRCGMFSVDWRVWMGEETAATPDGRKCGQPLSKNTAASIGQDRNGVTALMSSMLKLDGTQIPDGYVADIVLHSSSVAGEDGMTAFKGLLTTFMRKGGFSVHFNVLNTDVLLKAQKEPEKYQNLQIRLCGWNVRFVDLSEKVQNEFILQSRQ